MVLVSLSTIAKLMRASNFQSHNGLDSKNTDTSATNSGGDMTIQTTASATSSPATSPTLTACTSPVGASMKDQQRRHLASSVDTTMKEISSCEYESTDDYPVLISDELRRKRYDIQDSGSESDTTITTSTSYGHPSASSTSSIDNNIQNDENDAEAGDDDEEEEQTTQYDNDNENDNDDNDVDVQVELIGEGVVAAVPGKLFIGGMTPDTTEADLRAHFAPFGRVAHVVIIRHTISRMSRGFGFLTFEHQESATNFLSQLKDCKGGDGDGGSGGGGGVDVHVINGRAVEVHHALPRPSERLNSKQRMQQQQHVSSPVKSSPQGHTRPSTNINALKTSAEGRIGNVKCDLRGRAVSCGDIDATSGANRGRGMRSTSFNSSDVDVDGVDDKVGSLTLTVDAQIEGNNSAVPARRVGRHGPYPSMNRRNVSESLANLVGRPSVGEDDAVAGAAAAATLAAECESPHGMRWRAMSESVLCATPTHNVDSRSRQGTFSSSTSEDNEDEEEGGEFVKHNAFKVFVGGLPPNVRTKDLRVYFSTFGSLRDAVVLFDRSTNRSRGFGFVTFVRAADARLVCSPVRTHAHELMGKWIEVKSAETRETMASLASSVSLASSADTKSPSNYNRKMRASSGGGSGKGVSKLGMSARRYNKTSRPQGNMATSGHRHQHHSQEHYMAVHEYSHGGYQYPNNTYREMYVPYMDPVQQQQYAYNMQQQQQYQQQQYYYQQQQYHYQQQQHPTVGMASPHLDYYCPSPPLPMSPHQTYTHVPTGMSTQMPMGVPAMAFMDQKSPLPSSSANLTAEAATDDDAPAAMGVDTPVDTTTTATAVATTDDMTAASSDGADTGAVAAATGVH